MSKVEARLLKRDLFGTVTLLEPASGPQPGSALAHPGRAIVRRDTSTSRWWTRPLARALARREARALARLHGVAGVPQLLAFDGHILDRQWIPGMPMQVAQPRDPAYYRAALHLLRRLHTSRVAHNDLAKEPNWLVTEDGPALVDFQLAMAVQHRGRLFRTLAHDDLRHMLKHKRTYLPELLTTRERRILATRSWPARIWMATGKRAYRFVTRRILHWSDREGAGDRQL
ncbi:MAG TPA: RIO1 family regulatory kinase/ATPase [Steroidobacteraceae bacterium]|nr:RIO1 family regulatory kinase/ATPase [Steroidobacteraceae bacterium]